MSICKSVHYAIISKALTPSHLLLICSTLRPIAFPQIAYGKASYLFGKLTAL